MNDNEEPTFTAWRCTVCGYVHRGSVPPDTCPICGAPLDQFEPHADAAAATPPAERAAEWRCINCGYVHNDVQPPEACSLCGAAADRFEPLIAAPAPAVDAQRELRVVIVGAGIAGVSAAESVRKALPAAQITLLSREEFFPYYRLNLTRYLAGEIARDVLPIHSTEWYRDNRITLWVGSEAAALQLDRSAVALADGEEIGFDRLILAMGSHPFVPALPGVETPGVMTLRTARDATWILDVARSGTPCVLIGGGVLGLETAGALAMRGADVTVLESHAWLMPRQVNRKAGERLARHVEKLGIKLRMQARTRAIEGEGTVSGVLLDDGTVVPAGLVILTTGVRPNTHLARQAGLDVAQGIIVNNHLACSRPEVYAAGDVAEHNGVLYGAWEASQYQGSLAGLNAAGVPTLFGGLPRANTLKVLGLDLTSLGKFEPEDGSYLVLEQEDEAHYLRLVLRDGALVGAILLGDAHTAAAVKRAIEKKTDCSGVLLRKASAAELLDHLQQA